eukprot:8213992-Pyramimonas_sp.AAC.1
MPAPLREKDSADVQGSESVAPNSIVLLKVSAQPTGLRQSSPPATTNGSSDASNKSLSQQVSVTPPI